MKQPTLKLMNVKLSLRDRQLISKLQKQHQLTFSELVRRAIREYGAATLEKSA